MSSYDDFATTFAHSRDSMKWQDIEYCLDRVKSLVMTDAPHILDIGAGNGRHIPDIILRWDRAGYVGIDVSAGMIREARSRYPDHDLRQLDMRSVKTIDGVFDVVCFFASFHHLETAGERLAALRDLRSILYVGSIVCMTNWYLLSPVLLARYSSMRTGEQDFAIKIGVHTRYYHAFTDDELVGLVEAAGYTVVEQGIGPSGRNLTTIFKVS